MHKNDQWVLTHNFVNDTIALAYGGPADQIILETLEI